MKLTPGCGDGRGPEGELDLGGFTSAEATIVREFLHGPWTLSWSSPNLWSLGSQVYGWLQGPRYAPRAVVLSIDPSS